MRFMSSGSRWFSGRIAIILPLRLVRGTGSGSRMTDADASPHIAQVFGRAMGVMTTHNAQRNNSLEQLQIEQHMMLRFCGIPRLCFICGASFFLAGFATASAASNVLSRGWVMITARRWFLGKVVNNVVTGGRLCRSRGLAQHSQRTLRSASVVTASGAITGSQRSRSQRSLSQPA